MCSSSEIKIKILPDNRILIERGSDKINKDVFEALLPVVENKEEFENFLFQWPDREIIAGETDLCG